MKGDPSIPSNGGRTSLMLPDRPPTSHVLAGLPEVGRSVIDLIGNTPMLHLSSLTSGRGCPVVAKLEFLNPGGSVKDRAALAMIEAAEACGALADGGVIVEPTSGNTGVGLAQVAAQRGYRCVFTVPDKVSAEKIALLRSYGADVYVCPTAVEADDPRSYYSVADRLTAEIPGAFQPNQYWNPANVEAHYSTTGPEIWRQTQGRITHFVAGAGTGGTISGVGRYLKEQNPDVQIVCADPEGSVFSGARAHPYLVEGVGEDFIPGNYAEALVDRVETVSDAESFMMCRELVAQEGLLVGGSGGLALVAAARVASQLSGDELVVVLLPDGGRHYISKLYSDDWMERHGFTRGGAGNVQAALCRSARPIAVPFLQTGATIGEAAALLACTGLPSVPVVAGDSLVSAAQMAGSISTSAVRSALSAGASLDDIVTSHLKAPLPTVGIGQCVDSVLSSISAESLVVLDRGRPVAVVPRDSLNAGALASLIARLAGDPG